MGISVYTNQKGPLQNALSSLWSYWVITE